MVVSIFSSSARTCSISGFSSIRASGRDGLDELQRLLVLGLVLQRHGRQLVLEPRRHSASLGQLGGRHLPFVHVSPCGSRPPPVSNSARSSANRGSSRTAGHCRDALSCDRLKATASAALRNGISRIILAEIGVSAIRRAEVWIRGSESWSRAAFRASPFSTSAAGGVVLDPLHEGVVGVPVLGEIRVSAGEILAGRLLLREVDVLVPADGGIGVDGAGDGRLPVVDARAHVEVTQAAGDVALDRPPQPPQP